MEKKGIERQPRWDREEVVMLVVEYFRTKKLSQNEINESIEFLSQFLRIRGTKLRKEINERYRNIDGIRMKFANIKSLDSEYIKSGRTGLSGVSKMDTQIVEEYYMDKYRIKAEAYEILRKYVVQ